MDDDNADASVAHAPAPTVLKKGDEEEEDQSEETDLAGDDVTDDDEEFMEVLLLPLSSTTVENDDDDNPIPNLDSSSTAAAVVVPQEEAANRSTGRAVTETKNTMTGGGIVLEFWKMIFSLFLLDFIYINKKTKGRNLLQNNKNNNSENEDRL